ncbi:spermine/spermidine synthase domain-containing protein [Streptomyces daliensis]|uniref:Spermidine synthase n=1 Tax=Streptomyces daliensis TaxID=299421 RepID=A0A8T4J1H6_9ACTN|nr:spermidine synthase [Streptomyces daliensis]
MPFPSPHPDTTTGPVVLDRREGPYGEVVLRRHGELLQIIANGCFLMDTSDGRSERLLVRAALDRLDRLAPGTDAPALLIGGLGVGFSLAEAAAEPRWGRVTVVEREEAVIDWHRGDGPLSAVTAEALRDPRCEVAHDDLLSHLRAAPGRYDAVCMDVDNGPGWTVTEDNGSLYAPSGLALCREALRPGGVLAVWSAQPSPTFDDTLRNAGFTRVRTEEISVARGVPDVVHFATKPA